MQEQQEFALANNQIADIYQSMLNGDKSALSKLQQINPINQLPQLHHKSINRKAKINTQINTSGQQQISQSQAFKSSKQAIDIKESISLANVMSKKEQMYMNAIKRGAKMGAIARNQHVDKFFKPPKRLAHSQKQEYLSQNKEAKQKKKIKKEEKLRQQFSVELRSNLTAHAGIIKNNKIYALPKVQKEKQMAKNQSKHVATKKHASVSEPDRQSRQKTKLQKVDFKQMIGKSKQQRHQFSQQNEQELALQMQIVTLHKNKKDFLQYIRIKFDLNYNNRHKFLKKKKKPEDIYGFKNKEPEIKPDNSSPFKVQMQYQKQKCDILHQDINSLKILFNQNIGSLNKLERSIANLPYAKFLENKVDCMSQVSEEEDDTVEPLETSSDLRNKYRHIMANTRDKKWGLIQRTQYEAQRTESLSQSRQAGTQSRFTQNNDHKVIGRGNQQNKIVINQRLKNLLFT